MNSRASDVFFRSNPALGNLEIVASGLDRRSRKSLDVCPATIPGDHPGHLFDRVNHVLADLPAEKVFENPYQCTSHIYFENHVLFLDSHYLTSQAS